MISIYSVHVSGDEPSGPGSELQAWSEAPKSPSPGPSGPGDSELAVLMAMAGYFRHT